MLGYSGVPEYRRTPRAHVTSVPEYRTKPGLPRAMQISTSAPDIRNSGGDSRRSGQWPGSSVFRRSGTPENKRVSRDNRLQGDDEVPRSSGTLGSNSRPWVSSVPEHRRIFAALLRYSGVQARFRARPERILGRRGDTTGSSLKKFLDRRRIASPATS